MKKLKRISQILRNNSFGDLVRKSLSYFSAESVAQREKYKEMLREVDAGKKFEMIHANNLWDSSESVSGHGSTLKTTENLRKNLPVIFEKYDIKSVLDAPCGDFNWMRLVLDQNKNVKYIGGDIVGKIIEDNQRYSSGMISFVHMDITKDDLPKCDIMIVRDCLFHLSFQDISNFLENFSRSEIKYLLTTTHVFSKPHQNEDIVTGDFRLIDIFSKPFSFDKSSCLEAIDDWAPPLPERQMLLFAKDKLPSSLNLPA